MKIISWNLKNIGTTKIANNFTNPIISQSGLGNNVLDYVSRVVTSKAGWSAITGNYPFDIFVIIELKTGGNKKGQLATGSSIPVLAAFVNMLNNIVNTGYNAPNTNPNYQYASAQQLIVGNKETVGVIYNTRVLTFNNSSVLRNDQTGNYMLPRTPFKVEFTDKTTNEPLNIIGIHAPPPSGKQLTRFQKPIQFINQLDSSDDINMMNYMEIEDTLIMGDYNCDEGDTYGNAQTSFTIDNYDTRLPIGTLSSMRGRYVGANPTPTDYLNEAYDNIYYQFAGENPAALSGVRLDLIANAKRSTVPQPYPNLYQGNGVAPALALFNQYWIVSDHMPVAIRF